MSNANKCLIIGSSRLTNDIGLLALRVFFGGSLFALHGLDKISNFSALTAAGSNFPDPLRIGVTATVLLVIFAEVLAALLIVAGAFTRIASLIVAFNMFVAFAAVHHFALKGAGSGELAFLYFAAAAVLVIAGAGGYSVERIFCRCKDSNDSCSCKV